MDRRWCSSVALSAALFLSAGASFAAQDAPYRGKNLVVVAFDALKPRNLSAFGYPLKSAPNIDRMLSSSYVFKNAVSPAPWTVPAYMSVFTSMYPSEHKVTNKFVEAKSDNSAEPRVVIANLDRLSPNTPTLASILSAAGYATGGFTGDAGASAVYGNSKGFDEYFDAVMFGGLDESVPRAIEWMKKNRGKKKFLFVHGYDVHGQNVPSSGLDYRYVKKPYSGKYTGSKEEQAALRERGLSGERIVMTDEDVAFWRAVYDEKLARADARFGDLLGYIESAGEMEDTVFVMMSDHGTEVMEHGRFDHGHTLYGELVDVLLSIRLPGQKNRVDVQSLVSTMDLAPTVLSLLGVPPPAGSRMRGVDLSPAFGGKDVSHDVYVETDYRMYTHKRGLRTKDGWKYVMTMETGEEELYNLSADPAEKVNVAAAESARLSGLRTSLKEHLKEMGTGDGTWETGCLPVYADQCKKVQAPAKKPNVMIINVDSLRAQQVGAYGYEGGITPFLDSFFGTGATFLQAIAPAYLTFQTDASILTGLFPSQHNVSSFRTPMRASVNTLPKILSEAGYSTAAFVSPSLYRHLGLDKGFSLYHMDNVAKNISSSRLRVAEWASSAKQPFFVFWHIYDAHLPFLHPKPPSPMSSYKGPFVDQMSLRMEGQSRTEVPKKTFGPDGKPSFSASDPGDVFASRVPMTDNDVAYLRAGYDEGIRYVDGQLREFMDSIRDKPFFKDTVFILSSEHGEDLKEHGFVMHRDVYDVVVRVPLALVGPGFPPSKVSEPVSLLDLFPTVLEIASVPYTSGYEGKSLIPLVRGGSYERDIYTERLPFGEVAVRSGRYKYIARNPEKSERKKFLSEIDDGFVRMLAENEDDYSGDEMYDVLSDPWEKSNLAGKGLAEETMLKARTDAFLMRMDASRKGGAVVPLKPMPGPSRVLPYP